MSLAADHLDARVGENLLALDDVGAFHPDHQRHVELHLLRRLDHALRQHVASHDAAEDVDQHAFDALVREQDAKRRGDLLGARAAADVEEVGRLRAVELDDVHRRHREARAVHHASDVAVEMHVAEVELRRLGLGGIFFVGIAQLADIRMAEQRIVVERHFRVEADDAVVLRHDQRIDLD